MQPGESLFPCQQTELAPFPQQHQNSRILAVSQPDAFLAFRSDKPGGILRSQFCTGKGTGQRNTKPFLPFSGWLNRATQRVSLHGRA